MPHFPYLFFEEYIVRTPLFSHTLFKEKVTIEEVSEEVLKEIFENPVFQEAIYLASPYVHRELDKWFNSEKEFSPKELKKLKNTIFKYYSRMSTRPTPFGLFSGVGLGKFNKETVKSSFHSKRIRDTKLDMHFLVAFSKHIEKIPEIKNQLLYFPNNSVYKVGNKIRYVEYEYFNGKRDYITSSAPISGELEQVLEFSKEGKTIQQIANILINEEIISEEATEFIQELIDNQVLVSEIEPNVSGEDFLHHLISLLKKVGAKKEFYTLISIQSKLAALDRNIGNPISLYEEIEELIKSLETEYEQKYLFQTDLYFTNEFNLSIHWKKVLKKGISFLNKICLPQKETYFSTFKKAFYERFETEEVPLIFALDTEIGIGYRQDITTKGIHHYLEDLDIPVNKEKPELTIKLNPIQIILNQKLQEVFLENKYGVELLDEDFKDFEENWQDLPDTLSFMTEIISENPQEKLIIGNSGGSSAASLLGRFCSERSEVQNLTKAIAQKEETLNPDYILAEIIHLPEARIGNILRRPSLRQHEIPYLAKSILPQEAQISVDDLYISLKQNKIILRSKKLNKEVKPYLTNAHNYYVNSLPVYHFLCDLYSQNTRSGLYFDWGDLKHIYSFLPRVEYKNIILSKAQWKVAEKEIKQLLSLINDKESLINEIKNWRYKRQIPLWIQWVKSDNTLIVNLEKYDMLKMLIDTVKNEKSIIIEEFLYNENDNFIRQFIFSMYKHH